jgi:hypothetical protein
MSECPKRVCRAYELDEKLGNSGENDESGKCDPVELLRANEVSYCASGEEACGQSDADNPNALLRTTVPFLNYRQSMENLKE